MGALLGVVSSARNRRRRGGEEGQVGRLQEVTGKSGDGSGVRGDEERAHGRGRRVERGREKCRY